MNFWPDASNFLVPGIAVIALLVLLVLTLLGPVFAGIYLAVRLQGRRD